MPNQASRRVVVVHKQSLPLLSLLTTFVSVLLIVAGAIGLVLLQQPIQESQDVRSEAMVDNGPAVLTTNPGDNSNFRVNQEAKIDLVVNTGGVQASELSFVFSILTQTTDRVVIQTYSDSNLQITQQEIEEIEGGLLVIFKARPRTGTFSGNNSRVATVIFTPTRTGEFKLSFDAEKSTIYKANTSPSEDLLKKTSPFVFNIISSDVSVKSCNQTCGSNAECAPNHRCFEDRCRLVTNPTNTSCVNPPDQGLQRQCNEYCADTRECASGFTCFYNRCRRPDNPDSESCALSSQAVQQAIAQSCNKSCQSNADCAVNMRCHQSQCRLASNVSSTTCSPTTKRTVSPLYGGTNQATPSPTPAATLRPNATSRPSTQSGSATISGNVVPSSIPTPVPTPTVAPSIVPIPTPEPSSPLSSFMSQFGIGLPVIAMALGFILLLIVIILTIVNQIRRRGGHNSPTGTIGGNAGAYESQLQAKIDALKNQPPSATTSAPSAPPVQPLTPGVRPPQTSAQPVPLSSAPSVQPPPSTPTIQPLPATPPQATLRPAGSAVVPKTTFTPPPSTLATPVPPPTAPTSMLDRIKQKGVALPGQPGNGLAHSTDQASPNQSNNSQNTQG